MFTVSGYLSEDFSEETFELRHGKEIFSARRLDGAERLDFSALKNPKDKILFVLSHCLLDGDSKLPIGSDNALKFLQRYDSLSTTLASEILNITLKSLKADAEYWELSKKK